MAPVDRIDHAGLEQQIKDVVQGLYQIMVQVSTYDAMGRTSSREVLGNEIKTLSRTLQTLHTSASPPNNLPSVPPELLEYVENGRNPDIYTREFVELVRRGNQLMRGKMHAFGSFRDILAADIAAAMPELRQDVDKVCEATGGKAPPSAVAAPAEGEAAAPAAVGTAAAAAASTATGAPTTTTTAAPATADGAAPTASQSATSGTPAAGPAPAPGSAPAPAPAPAPTPSAES